MSNSKRRRGIFHRCRLPVLVAAVCSPLMLGVPATSQAALQARLDRSTVDSGGTFTLDIEAEGTSSGAQPDLSPLQKDFIVLGSATQSETSIINGRRSDRLHWSVKLQPRRTGALVIPPITVGGEHTDALPLAVESPSPREAAEMAQHVFVEAGIAGPARSIYVQQQVPYAVRLYYDDTIRKGELAAPRMADAVVEQLGDDQRGTATRGGRTYHVIERNYAISPEKSGTLRIPPVTFSGSQVSQQGGPGQPAVDPGDDLMARMLRNTPFANDPLLGGTPFADAEQPVSAQGKELVLAVKPRPAGVRGDWLPADAITLHDSWQDHPPQLKAGEPATRTITIEAKGLSASQIPPLSLAQPADARLYPEPADNQSRTDGRTIFGISTQKVTYIPNAEGRLDVPPVELTWWDIGSDASRKATLPALALRVAPGVAGDATIPRSAHQPAGALGGPAATDHSTSGSARVVSSPGLLEDRGWVAAGGLLAALLVAIGLVVGRRRRRATGGDAPAASVVRVPSKASGLRALRQACAANDARTAANALLDLAHAQWPDDPPRTLTALALRLEEGAEAVGSLERSLYGTGDAPVWRGDSLLQIVRRGLRPRRGDASLRDDGLTALYPFRSETALGSQSI